MNYDYISYIISIRRTSRCFFFFFFNDTATTEIYTLSLHDALPISPGGPLRFWTSLITILILTSAALTITAWRVASRLEEHTSELQSPCNLVCRLLLEKKKKINADDQSVFVHCQDAQSILYYV